VCGARRFELEERSKIHGFFQEATNLPDFGARQVRAATESCAPEFPSGVARSVPLARFLLVENVLQLGDENGLERRFLECSAQSEDAPVMFSRTIVGLPGMSRPMCREMTRA
jgi:hypothetical protein